MAGWCGSEALSSALSSVIPCRSLTMFWLISVVTGMLANHHCVTFAASPAFDNSMYVTTLYEQEQTEITLANLTCTDADVNDVTKISLTSVSPSSPCGSCFSVYPASQCDTGVDYCLKFLPGIGTLNQQAAPEYDVIVTCTDGTNSVNASVNVRLTLNTPPRFQPNQLVASTTVLNTKSVKAGAIIYDVNATDDQIDNVLFIMTSSPASTFFEIGTGDGLIRAQHDLASLCLTAITFYVNITDGFTGPVGPLAVHITLDGSNVAPDIINLDRSIQVKEDTAIGDVILAMAANDDAAVTKLSYSLSAIPSANLVYFEITGQNIKVSDTLNFESASDRTTNLTVMATDDEGCTSSLHYLYVTVTDVNETPELLPAHAAFSVYEGPDFGNPPLSIPWIVADPDFVDTHIYSIISDFDLNLFSIDRSSGQLSINGDYDIDNGNMPTTQTLTVQVTDRAGTGLSANATVVLLFKDRNDHAPVITTTVSDFTVCANSGQGSNLGTLFCTDEDSSFQGNNDTYFTGSSTGITILANGGIVLSLAPSLGQTYTASAYCNDRGQFPGPLQSTAPVDISVTGINCPTTAPAPVVTPALTTPAPMTTAATLTTTTPSTTSVLAGGRLEENLPWVMVAALLATTLLALLVYMGYIFCWHRWREGWNNCCQRQPPKSRRLRTPPHKITPVETPTPLPAVVEVPTPYLYDFWKERYTDNDYDKQPNRASHPRPVTPPVGSSPAQTDSSPAPKKRSCCAIL